MKQYQPAQFAGLFSEGVDPETPMTYEQWRAKRRAIIEEDFFLTLFRWCADAAYLAHPRCIASLPASYAAAKSKPGPDLPASPDARYSRPLRNGFVAAACDLSLPAVLDAYGRGLLLQWLGGSPAWWSPAQRVTGNPADATAPEAALGLLEYASVAKHCARKAILRGQPLQPGQSGLATLTRLHDAGFAHSVEIWDKAGNLIGGCHGIANGRAFFTQASFGFTPAAEDLALVALNRHLALWDFCCHDISAIRNGSSFGFREQSREDLLSCLAVCLSGDRRGRWLADPELCCSR
jgi:leucyl/phenylalanyl-tRNA---protein transferase